MIPRVHYRERQVLRKNDLIEEQRYRLLMQRAHFSGLHAWGIATGLRLVAAEDELLVTAGVAVDGYGRFLTLSDDLTIALPLMMEQLGDGVFDVWLTYWQWLNDQNRWQEEVRIRLTEAQLDETGQPVAVAPRDLDESKVDDSVDVLAQGELGLAANQEWPVYLGQVSIDETAGLTVLAPQRPYTHLRTGQLTTPTGEVQIQVGNELTQDPIRFAVSVDGQPGLTVDVQGKTAVHANAHLQQEMTLESGSPLYFDKPIAAPEVAAPWQLYRTAVATEKKALAQLRLELFHPGDKGNPADNQWVVGYWDGNDFIKCFQVAADKTVTVFNDVMMQPGKQVNEGPVEMDLADERFAATLLGNMVSGMSTAAPQVDAIYNTPLEIKLTSLSSPNSRDLTFTYTVSISNLMETAIQNIRFLELQVVEGRSQKERHSTNMIESLSKGVSQVNEQSEIFPDLQPNQKITLIVTAIGTMISGEQVQATATKNLIVQPPPPPTG